MAGLVKRAAPRSGERRRASNMCEIQVAWAGELSP
jgi:hypothetical protein